jgi:hypothetical protein
MSSRRAVGVADQLLGVGVEADAAGESGLIRLCAFSTLWECGEPCRWLRWPCASKGRCPCSLGPCAVAAGLPEPLRVVH